MGGAVLDRSGLKSLLASPVSGGKPLGPGAMKGSNSGTSVDSELELATAAVVRPRFVTLGRGPVGAVGAGEGSTTGAGSDMALVTTGGLKKSRILLLLLVAPIEIELVFLDQFR